LIGASAASRLRLTPNAKIDPEIRAALEKIGN
jgi:hypothetical protein